MYDCGVLVTLYNDEDNTIHMGRLWEVQDKTLGADGLDG
jgi:hypothetical protein